MSENGFHLAQINIARLLAPLDDPLMDGFVSRLDEINKLADESPGFNWRLQTEEGNATYLRPYDDESIIVNMSVWESIEHLKEFVYRTQHASVMRERAEWFSKFEGAFIALWYVPVGHIPTVNEAKERLDYLRTHGESPYAFSFKRTYQASEAAQFNTSTLTKSQCK